MSFFSSHIFQALGINWQDSQVLNMKPLDERSAKASQCCLSASKEEFLNYTVSTELNLNTLNKGNVNRKYLIPHWSSETDVKMKLKYGKWLEALTVSIDIISANEKPSPQTKQITPQQNKQASKLKSD